MHAESMGKNQMVTQAPKRVVTRLGIFAIVGAAALVVSCNDIRRFSYRSPHEQPPAPERREAGPQVKDGANPETAAAEGGAASRLDATPDVPADAPADQATQDAMNDGSSNREVTANCLPETITASRGSESDELGCLAGGRAASCGVDQDGSMHMNVCFGCSPTREANCQFSPVLLNRFDADHGNGGVLEIRFCNSKKLDEQIVLSYGVRPSDKYLTLAEKDTPPGCHRKFIRPSDVKCDDAASVGLPMGCMLGIGECPGGRWTSYNRPQCLFSYDQIPLRLESTFCLPVASHVEVTIDRIRLRYHPPGCGCKQDSDCRDATRPVCDTAIAGLSPGDGLCVEF
jgi:hypothetical protein